MEKTAQQTSRQGTLVGENRASDGNENPHIGSDTTLSPGGSDTPQKDSEQLSHGQESYPGRRPENVTQEPGENPPVAGDTDPGSTESATETGQDGDLTKDKKKKAFAYT